MCAFCDFFYDLCVFLFMLLRFGVALFVMSACLNEFYIFAIIELFEYLRWLKMLEKSNNAPKLFYLIYLFQTLGAHCHPCAEPWVWG